MRDALDARATLKMANACVKLVTLSMLKPMNAKKLSMDWQKEIWWETQLAM